MINPFTATGYFHRQQSRWPTFLAMWFKILKEGMGLPLSDAYELEVQYHVIKKVTLSRYMMAPKLRPGAVTCTAQVPASTSRSSKFLQPPSAHRLNTRSNDGEGEDFFFTFEGLSSV